MKALIEPRGLMSLRNEMDRLFGRFADGDWDDLVSRNEWNPALEMFEDKDFVTCRLELPGMDPKDVKITLRDKVLTVRGEKLDEREEKDETYFRSERKYGTFTRSILLAVPVEGAKVIASFKNGLLTIQLPKAAAARDEEIAIKIA